MPELPEVETVRRSLEPHLLGQTVSNATLRRKDILTGPGSPVDLLEGDRVVQLRRHGKQIAVVGQSGRVVVVQLGMTGQVLVHRHEEPLPSHSHAAWTTSSGTTLIFRDPRRFGGLTTFADQRGLDQLWKNLGPDALAVSDEQLAAALKGRRRPIKAALLDQTLLAGVGNIYADEALFASGIHPRAFAHRLKPHRVSNLAAALRTVLAQAVEAGGTTLRDYLDANGAAGSYLAAHAVYGRHGQPCTRCGAILKRSTVAQRTTSHCATCQSR